MGLHENIVVIKSAEDRKAFEDKYGPIKNVENIHGKFWVARAPMPKGALLWWPNPEDVKYSVRLSLQQVREMPDKEREEYLALAYQIDDNTMEGFPPCRDWSKLGIPETVLQENYVNHSCDGNGWYENESRLVAFRDIEVGEEVCYDYALTECSDEFVIEHCSCGAKDCRGRITGNDWKLSALRKKFAGRFLPHINALIESEA